MRVNKAILREIRDTHRVLADAHHVQCHRHLASTWETCAAPLCRAAQKIEADLTALIEPNVVTPKQQRRQIIARQIEARA